MNSKTFLPLLLLHILPRQVTIPPFKARTLKGGVNYIIKRNSQKKKESIQICGKIEPRTPIYTKEICMNYRHFSVKERCPLQKYYAKGKSYRELQDRSAERQVKCQ